MGFLACPYKSLRLTRTLPTGYGSEKLLPGGVHCIERRQHRLLSPPKVVSRLRADPEHKTASSNGAHLALQASLVAISLSIPFAAPFKAWAGEKIVKEAPVAVVVEEEPAALRQARVLAKQADDQLFAILQAAKDSSTYVRVQSGAALSRAETLKQQLVAEYGNPAALERTEVRAAGAVVSLVVLVILFKAITSVFSSPTEAVPIEESASSDTPAVPPTSPAPVASVETVVAAVEPVVAAPAAAKVEPLDVQSAAAVAAQMRDLFRDDPARFALMAEWLRSPAATKIRPQLVEEMTRIAALTTSSRDEDDLPPPPPPASVSNTTAASNPTTTATTSSNDSSTSSPTNGVVPTTRRSVRSVDTRQLLALVEWLSSPGAAPVRDKLGAEVADQVAIWASARVGLKFEPLPIRAPAAAGLNGAVTSTSSATTEATETSAEPTTVDTSATEPVTAETLTEAPSASPEVIATEAAEPVASSEPIAAELTETPVPGTLAETPEAAVTPDPSTEVAPDSSSEVTPDFSTETVQEEAVTEAGLNTTQTTFEGTAIEEAVDAGTSASAESSTIEAVTDTIPSSDSVVIDAPVAEAVIDAPVAEALSPESVLVIEAAEPKVVVPQAAVAEPVAEAKVSEEPAKPKTLVDVLNKKGPATPALLALGFGALALDAMVGMSKSIIKNTSLKSTQNSSSQSTKASPRNGVAPSTQNSTAKTESVAPMPIVPPFELESVTFSFDEEEASKVVSKSS